MNQITIAQGDTLPILSATLTDANGPVDLTGCTIQFRMANEAGTLVASGACAIVGSPTAGLVSYTWKTGDTALAGWYTAQFVVTQLGGGIWHFPNTGKLSVAISPTF